MKLSATFFRLLGALLLSGGAYPACAVLGDTANDLTFVPISACRIVDTRNAGGQLVAGVTRDVDIATVTNYSGQGGEATNCSGLGNVGAFAAVAVNFTVINPNISGTLKAWSYGGTEPTAIAMSFAAGETRTNFAIVKVAQLSASPEMTVKTSATAHLTVDVVGYYIAPQATAPNCVNTSVSSFTVLANATNFFNNPTCPAGYVAVTPYCWTASSGVYSQGSGYNANSFGNPTFCSWQNTTAASQTVFGGNVCCRVPGR